MEWSLEDILQITGAKIIRRPVGDRFRIVKRYDGPGSLYFPLGPSPGETEVQRLIRSGVSGIIIHQQHPTPWADLYPDLGILSLRFPAQGYFEMAAEARNRFRGGLVGITGSSGKTSTKEHLAAVLATRCRVSATPESFNLRSDGAGLLLASEGTPDEAIVMEMGFGRIGDIERMGKMARPDVGIITKVTLDHLDGTGGSWEVLVREKGKLGNHVEPDGLLAIHAEDPGCLMLDRSLYRCRVMTFGAGKDADVRYEDVTTGEFGTTMTLNLLGRRYPVRLRNFGLVQAANAAAAALAAHGLGLTPTEIVEGLERTPTLPRRFQIHPFQHGLTVIDDTWSASVDAMSRGLETAASLAGRRRRIAVLTGIGNLHNRTPELHRELGEMVPRLGYSELFLIAPDERTAAMKEGALKGGLAPEQIHEIPQAEAPAHLVRFAAGNTLMYWKTSQYLWLAPQIDSFLAAVKARGFEPLTE